MYYSSKSNNTLIAFFERKRRFNKITKIGARLTERYREAFILPITQSHLLAKHMNNSSTGFKDWVDIDYSHIEHSDEVWVVMMSGWKESVGVQAEIEYALNHKKPLRYINAETCDITANYTVHIPDNSLCQYRPESQRCKSEFDISVTCTL